MQLVDPKDFLRFKDLGVIADFQLLWAKREPANEKPLEPYLGAERLVNRQERAASGTGTRKRAGADGILCVSTDATEISNQLSGELGRYAGSGLLDKDALSDQELYDMVVLAVFGGVDTTRNQLGLAISLFVENPDQWRLLADRPELARNAVEEVMRMRPTTTWVTREAMEGLHL